MQRRCRAGCLTSGSSTEEARRSREGGRVARPEVEAPEVCFTSHQGKEDPPNHFKDQRRSHLLQQGESYQHLGVPTGFRVDPTPRDTMARLEEEARQVFNSLFAPWQKIHALKTFILTQLDFCLRTARVHKTAFKALDNFIMVLRASCQMSVCYMQTFC
ncbi:hypothetical protein KUF71_015539 [Frankliniella fusca]|uniref:Uncharacterized protein n=1 Tax=Frankliniella fusca TaxID=407009 RepID=A0AAE1HTT1_9NEOP|nr:hypothetical protein KUF71_015539 [Frankliniella fusca]